MLPQKSKFDEYVKIGLIRSQTQDDLTIYQYTELTQFDRLWNSVTLNARGIVFDNKGRVVQRCLPKFFNSDEPEGIIAAKTLKADKPVVQDKLDGSLIKISKNEEYGLVITSKASFQSDQAKWATTIVKEQEYTFETGLTYCFELIHPDNQIVLNYGDKRAIVLLAVIDNETGKELDIYKDKFDQFERVELLPESVLSDVNKLNEKGLREGIVVNFGAYRLKMKTDEYVRLHRIVTDFTPKRVWEALAEGQEIERQNIPEEFLEWLTATENELKQQYQSLYDEAVKSYESTKHMTDKEIGLSNLENKSFIFSLRNGRDISPMIWKQIKPKQEAADV